MFNEIPFSNKAIVIFIKESESAPKLIISSLIPIGETFKFASIIRVKVFSKSVLGATYSTSRSVLIGKAANFFLVIRLIKEQTQFLISYSDRLQVFLAFLQKD